VVKSLADVLSLVFLLPVLILNICLIYGLLCMKSWHFMQYMMVLRIFWCVVEVPWHLLFSGFVAFTFYWFCNAYFYCIPLFWALDGSGFLDSNCSFRSRNSSVIPFSSSCSFAILAEE